MVTRTAIACFAVLLLAASCSTQRECDPGFKNYDVYLYRTPEETFLFFKKDRKKPIGFDAEENPEFSRKIDEIFSAYYGRDVGVEVSVCGKIVSVDLPLYTYNESLVIHQAEVIRKTDLTDLILHYRKQIGTPGV